MTHSNSIQTKTPSLNRREFLYYVLGGSIVLAAGGAAAGLLRYATPSDKDRYVTLKADDLPSRNSAELFGYNRFFIAHDINALSIFDIRCTYKGCIVR